jgi:RimJ/RimL family protein N-acetyltransferase
VDAPRRPLEHPDPPLTDGVVALRPWRDDDAPALMAICDDPLAARFTNVPVPYAEADAREWIAGRRESQAAGAGIVFAIVQPPDDTPVGNIGLRLNEHAVGETGYLTAARARGQGLMPRALDLMTRWAFAELGLARVQLLTHPENAASQRVAEKAGFQREGLLRRHSLQRGRRIDVICWARLPADPVPPVG